MVRCSHVYVTVTVVARFTRLRTTLRYAHVHTHTLLRLLYIYRLRLLFVTVSRFAVTVTRLRLRLALPHVAVANVGTARSLRLVTPFVALVTLLRWFTRLRLIPVALPLLFTVTVTFHTYHVTTVTFVVDVYVAVATRLPVYGCVLRVAFVVLGWLRCVAGYGRVCCCCRCPRCYGLRLCRCVTRLDSRTLLVSGCSTFGLRTLHVYPPSVLFTVGYPLVGRYGYLHLRWLFIRTHVVTTHRVGYFTRLLVVTVGCGYVTLVTVYRLPLPVAHTQLVGYVVHGYAVPVYCYRPIYSPRLQRLVGCGYVTLYTFPFWTLGLVVVAYVYVWFTFAVYVMPHVTGLRCGCGYVTFLRMQLPAVGLYTVTPHTVVRSHTHVHTFRARVTVVLICVHTFYVCPLRLRYVTPFTLLLRSTFTLFVPVVPVVGYVTVGYVVTLCVVVVRCYALFTFTLRYIYHVYTRLLVPVAARLVWFSCCYLYHVTFVPDFYVCGYVYVCCWLLVERYVCHVAVCRILILRLLRYAVTRVDYRLRIVALPYVTRCVYICCYVCYV